MQHMKAVTHLEVLELLDIVDHLVEARKEELHKTQEEVSALDHKLNKVCEGIRDVMQEPLVLPEVRKSGIFSSLRPKSKAAPANTNKERIHSQALKVLSLVGYPALVGYPTVGVTSTPGVPPASTPERIWLFNEGVSIYVAISPTREHQRLRSVAESLAKEVADLVGMREQLELSVKTEDTIFMSVEDYVKIKC